MRYWDTSAIVPLVIDEPGSALARAWLAEDSELVIWGLTAVELTAAVERRAQEGHVGPADRRTLLHRFGQLCASANEVSDLLAVRSRATSVLARHALRAADAAQLGAALVVAEGDPTSLTMVCLDRPLADAAEREGLHILTWPAPCAGGAPIVAQVHRSR